VGRHGRPEKREMPAAFLNTLKLTGPGKVLAAARHNLREIAAELGADSHIDSSRTQFNRVLAGPESAAEVAALADAATPARLRKDAVRAVEVVISLPGEHGVYDLERFFHDSLVWVLRFFGVRMLSAVLHVDEEFPHAHFLLLPLVDGRMIGSELVGNRNRLREMQADFYRNVSSQHGLTKPSTAGRMPSKQLRDGAAKMLYEAIVANPSVLLRPDVRMQLCECVARNPAPLAEVLGMAMPERQKKRRTFVQIMTKPVRSL